MPRRVTSTLVAVLGGCLAMAAAPPVSATASSAVTSGTARVAISAAVSATGVARRPAAAPVTSARVTPAPEPRPAPASLTAAAPSRDRQTRRIVLLPRPGHQVGGQAVRIVVRAPRSAKVTDARLNGMWIGGDLERVSRGRLATEASVSHGLRHGANVLRVRLRTGSGERRRQTLRFTVPHQRPLIGAGTDQRIRLGDQVLHLGALHSAPGGARADVQPATVSWEVIDAPAASRWAPVSGAPVPLPLDPAASALAPSFAPDAVGRYTVRATAVIDGEEETDTASTVVQAPPLIDVDTQATTADGHPAVRVGSAFYPAPQLFTDAPADNRWKGTEWHVVVLDRGNLNPISNTAYGTCVAPNVNNVCHRADTAAAPAWDSDTLAGLQHLDSTQLAIVVSHPQFPNGPGDPSGMLSHIGARGVDLSGGAGSVSIIGPGQDLPAGRAASPTHIDPDKQVPDLGPGVASSMSSPGNGRLAGYLARKAYLDGAQSRAYGYLARERLEFDTRSTTSCSPTTACTATLHIEGADRDATGTIPAGAGGYVVGVWDRFTLQRKGQQAFVTRKANESDPNNGQWYAGVWDMAQYLRGIGRGDVVMISSLVAQTESDTRASTMGPVPSSPARVGIPPYRWTGGSLDRDPHPDYYNPWVDLTNAVRLVGGTRHLFNRAAGSPGSGYSLVGWGGAGEGAGSEVQDADARLRGVLARGLDSEFRPENVNATGEVQDALQRAVLSSPLQDFVPEQEARAREYIVRNILQFENGLHDAYVNFSLKYGGDDGSKWLSLANSLSTDRNKAYPFTDESTAPFSRDAWSTAIDHLQTQLTQVSNVRMLIHLLQKPFGAENILTQWADKNALYAELLNRAKATDNSDLAWTIALDIVGTFLEMAAPIGAALAEGSKMAAKAIEKTVHAIHITAGVTAGTLEFIKTGFETPVEGSGEREADRDKELTTAAAELDKLLVNNALATSANLKFLGDVIVDDDAKIAAVGCSQKGCAYADAPSDDDVTAMQLMATRAAERTVYRKLVGTLYQVHALPRSKWDYGYPQGNWDPRTFMCHSSKYPLFAKAPEYSWTYLRQSVYPVGGLTPVFDAYVIADIDGMLYQGNVTYPNKEILERMFAPMENPVRSDDNPTPRPASAGGLGMDMRDFVRTSQQVAPWDNCASSVPYGWPVQQRNAPAADE